MAGQPAGRLSIEIVAEIARLQTDLDKAKRLVTAASGEIGRSAKAANDNLAGMGTAARGLSGDMARLKAALDPAWAAQEKFNAQQRLGMDAFKQGAISREQFIAHMRTINKELKENQGVNGRAVSSAGQMRSGMQQLGFQIGDFTTQISSGTSATQAFAQQIGQTFQAVQLMAGGTSKFATFLGGPWGLALNIGVTALAGLVGWMSKSDDAAKKSEKSHRDFAEVLRDNKAAWNEVAEAAAEYTKQQKKAREITILSAIETARDTANKLNNALATRIQLEAELKRTEKQIEDFASMPGGAGGMTVSMGQRDKVRQDMADNLKKMQDLTGAATEVQVAIATMVAEMNADPAVKMAKGFDILRDQAKNAGLSVEELTKRLTELNRQQKAVEEQAKKAGRAVSEDMRKVDFLRPVAGPITSPFGMRNGRRHAGVDIGVPVGTQVRAPAGGVVIESGVVSGYGNVVVIDHGGGTITRLAHLSKLLSPKNATVSAGDVIGLSGGARGAPGAGNSRGPHLHYEVLINGKPVDPTKGAFPIDPVKVHELGERARDAMKRELEKIERDAEATKAGLLRLDLELVDSVADARAKILAGMDNDLEKSWARMVENGQTAANVRLDQIEALADAMDRLKDAGRFDLGEVFGDAGTALDRMVDAIDRLTAAQEAYNEVKENGAATDKERADAERAYGDAKLAGTLSMLSATKKLFAEQSAGYRIIETMEKIATARALVRTAIYVAQGAAKMFAALGPFAFPVVAAMIAVMAGLGFRGGGSQKAPPTAKELQDKAGTGSVLGDASGKSNSIANSLEIVAANSDKDLEYSNEMLKSLRSIDDSISAMAGSVARQISVSGSMFDTSSARLGTSGSSGFLGLFASSTTRELWDLGIKLAGSTIGDIIAQGISGNTYQIVQQVKKSSGFLGIGGGTKTTYETTTGQIDPAIADAIQGVVVNLRNGLVTASKAVGIEGAEALLNGFRVELGTLSFKDMTGAEIEEQLNAVFSKVGDDMAGALLPAIASMQQIGEGLFETFMRLARQYQVVDTSLRSIGMAFGQVGVESLAARDALVQLFGGLDQFAEATRFFRDNFLTEAERMAPVMASVAAEMERLGMAGVDTIDAFKAAVLGLDLATEAGRSLYASLLQVAPAFASVEKYEAKQAEAAAEQLSRQRGLDIALLRAMGKAEEALALERMAELDGLDDAARKTKLLTWAFEDAANAIAAAQDKVASAKGVLQSAYDSASGNFTALADKLRGLAGDLRTYAASLTGGGGGGGDSRKALIDYMRVSGGARAGNEADARAFSGTAQTFLTSALANARNATEYTRAVAMVRRDAKAAAAMADSQADNATRQLAALDAMVKPLLGTEQNTLDVAQAIAALHAAEDELAAAEAARDKLTDPVPHLEMLAESAKAQLDSLGDIRSEIERRAADSDALLTDLRLVLTTIRGDTAKAATVLSNVASDGDAFNVKTAGTDTVATVAA